MNSTTPTARLSLIRLMHRPWKAVPVTLTLVLINSLVFAMMATTSGDALRLTPGLSIQWGANFGPATQEGQWWRLLTALFVHLSGVHIAVNMWALWDIGRLVEGLLGRWRYAVLFAGSGVIGNVLSLALQHQERVSSGASGAIFGLYGALIVFMWRERQRIASDEFRWVSTVAVAFSVLMLGLGAIIPSIDNAAHAGGLIGGMCLAMFLGHSAPGLNPPRRSSLVSTTGMLSIVAVVIVFLRLSSPSYRYVDELQTRHAMQQFVQEDQRLKDRWNVLMRAENAQSFDQLANAMQSDVVEPYQHSFEALASVSALDKVPSHAAFLQLQSYAQLRYADALRQEQALQSAASASIANPW